MIAPARRIGALGCAASVLAALALVGAPAAQADAVRDKQWYLGPLGIQQAWSITKGAGVKIGIVDSGVDGSATDLKGAVVGGKDFSTRGAANGQKPIAGDPHGTQVASMAAARGHGNGAGVIGSAPAASIISASIDENGLTNSSAGDAVRWLVGQGVGVINLSFFTTSDVSVSALHSAVNYAESKDVVVVAGTGDVYKGLTELEAPATFPGVVAVTGVDKTLKRDPSATIGTGTAIAAPFSTTPVKSFSNASYVGLPVVNPRGSSDGPYGNGTGTSLSAPIVSGVIALIRAKYPDLDAANVINRLLKTASPAGGSVPNTTYGYGIVNAQKALTAHVAKVSANPLGGVGPSSSPSAGPSSAPSASSAPHTGGSGPKSAHSAPGTGSDSPSAAAASGSSSGLGTGAWIAIVVAIIVVLAVVAGLIVRSRRPAAAAAGRPPIAPGPPPGRYGPPAPPPPGRPGPPEPPPNTPPNSAPRPPEPPR